MAKEPRVKPIRNGREAEAALALGPVNNTLTPLDGDIGELLSYRNNGPHRGPHQPTPALSKSIERAVGIGLSPEQIAYIAGIAPNVLREHYRTELDMGAAVLHGTIASGLVNIALDTADKRSVEASKYILSRRFHWTETTNVNVQATVEHQVIDARALDTDQREQLRELLTAALAPALPAPAEAEYEDAECDDSGEDLL